MGTTPEPHPRHVSSLVTQHLHFTRLGRGRATRSLSLPFHHTPCNTNNIITTRIPLPLTSLIFTSNSSDTFSPSVSSHSRSILGSTAPGHPIFQPPTHAPARPSHHTDFDTPTHPTTHPHIHKPTKMRSNSMSSLSSISSRSSSVEPEATMQIFVKNIAGDSEFKPCSSHHISRAHDYSSVRTTDSRVHIDGDALIPCSDTHESTRARTSAGLRREALEHSL